jgi:hypothetical protein
VYADKSRRILPTIRVSREPGQYRAVLQDHETCNQVSAASTTLQGIWEALERAMAVPLNWQPFKSYLNTTDAPHALRKKKAGQASTD